MFSHHKKLHLNALDDRHLNYETRVVLLYKYQNQIIKKKE